jgi:hypothetical protein
MPFPSTSKLVWTAAASGGSIAGGHTGADREGQLGLILTRREFAGDPGNEFTLLGVEIGELVEPAVQDVWRSLGSWQSPSVLAIAPRPEGWVLGLFSVFQTARGRPASTGCRISPLSIPADCWTGIDVSPSCLQCAWINVLWITGIRRRSVFKTKERWRW